MSESYRTPEMENHCFVQSVSLLVDLWRLVHDGHGDSDAADEIRDELDTYHNHLSDDKVRLLREVSGAFAKDFTVGMEPVVAVGKPPRV